MLVEPLGSVEPRLKITALARHQFTLLDDQTTGMRLMHRVEGLNDYTTAVTVFQCTWPQRHCQVELTDEHGWLHAKMIWRSADDHSSKYQPSPLKLINFIDQEKRLSTTPSHTYYAKHQKLRGNNKQKTGQQLQIMPSLKFSQPCHTTGSGKSDRQRQQQSRSKNRSLN